MSDDPEWLGSLNPDIDLCVGPIEFERDPNRKVNTLEGQPAHGSWRLAWTRNFDAWPLRVWSVGMRWRTNESLAGVLYGNVFNFSADAKLPPSEKEFLALFDHEDPDDESARFARVLSGRQQFADVFKDVNSVFGVSAFAADPTLLDCLHVDLIRAAARALRGRFRRLQRAAIIIEASDFFGSQPILSPDQVQKLQSMDQLRFREEVQRRFTLISGVRFSEQFIPTSSDTDTLLLQERFLE